jgi:hypothetical protein
MISIVRYCRHSLGRQTKEAYGRQIVHFGNLPGLHYMIELLDKHHRLLHDHRNECLDMTLCKSRREQLSELLPVFAIESNYTCLADDVAELFVPGLCFWEIVYL